MRFVGLAWMQVVLQGFELQILSIDQWWDGAASLGATIFALPLGLIVLFVILWARIQGGLILIAKGVKCRFYMACTNLR